LSEQALFTFQIGYRATAIACPKELSDHLAASILQRNVKITIESPMMITFKADGAIILPPFTRRRIGTPSAAHKTRSGVHIQDLEHFQLRDQILNEFCGSPANARN